MLLRRERISRKKFRPRGWASNSTRPRRASITRAAFHHLLPSWGEDAHHAQLDRIMYGNRVSSGKIEADLFQKSFSNHKTEICAQARGEVEFKIFMLVQIEEKLPTGVGSID